MQTMTNTHLFPFAQIVGTPGDLGVLEKPATSSVNSCSPQRQGPPKNHGKFDHFASGSRLSTMSNEESRMPTYEPGDFIKVEFQDESTGIGEWMWVRVHRCDEARQILFGILDNVPVNDASGKLGLGTELAINFSQVREHRKASEFKPHN